MRAKTLNEIEFNLKKNPTDKFRGGFQKGISRDPVKNPRKQGYMDLTDQEREVIARHEERIRELRDEIYDLEGEIEGLEGEVESLRSNDIDSAETEEFDAQVINRYGWNALDILNSGSSKEEKIKAIDALNPSNDFGIKEFENLMDEYDYYHPEEIDNSDKIEDLMNTIKKIQVQKQERENTKDKLETKIYNLENY